MYILEKCILIFSLFTSLVAGQDELQTVLEYYQSSSIQSGLETTPNGFLLNKLNITLYSGSIHYFRVHPDYWEDSLTKLSALGLIAVETYIPWNLHEPEEGKFDFGDGDNYMSPFLNLELFIQKAYEANLLVILRPGPYICAEWEFGGLPSWLLRIPGIKVRTFDEKFTSRVKAYFNYLLPIIAKWQFIKGGPVIAFQVENEYGGTGNVDLEYLTFIMNEMQSHGIEGLFFTSDNILLSGSKGALPGVLQTANFGDSPLVHLNKLMEIQPDKPAMVMEFWTGWYSHWMESHETTSVESFKNVLEQVLTFPASINMYMFQGGTSWGFMNGANYLGIFNSYQPDITSYDYDAVLTESGDYTLKYATAEELISRYSPIKFLKPSAPEEHLKFAYPKINITQQLSLDGLVAQVSTEDRMKSANVLPMELIDVNGGNGQSYGYVLYRKTNVSVGSNSTLQIMGHIRDIGIVVFNGKLQTEIFTSKDQIEHFGFWRQSDGVLNFNASSTGSSTLDILVENWGRNNFGFINIGDFEQYKGIVNGPVILDGLELFDWEIISLQFRSKWIQGLTNWIPFPQEYGKTPALYRATMNVSNIYDTFINMSLWGKGVVFVNGFTLGRYFSAGPQQTLYIPKSLLKEGLNEIIIFEHYTPASEITFSESPIFN